LGAVLHRLILPPATPQAPTAGRPRGTCSSGARRSRCVLGHTGNRPPMIYERLWRVPCERRWRSEKESL
jgi:hypothetical protein